MTEEGLLGDIVLKSLLVLTIGTVILGILRVSKKVRVVDPLSAEAPAPPANKYTWDEYLRDIEDPKVTFNQILEKYQLEGIPVRPPDKPPLPPELQKKSDRFQERMAWFKKMGEENPLMKLVPPPPPPPTVVAVTGQTIPCAQCKGGRTYPVNPAYPGYGSVQGAPSRKAPCSLCGGAGFMVITGS
jgi:hypothetical protein